VRLGNDAAGNLSIYQKILIIFSIIPVALIPHLSTAIGKINPTKIMRTSIRYIWFANLCILIVMIFAKDYFFKVISDGKIQPNSIIVVLAVINGIIGSLAVPAIQSSSIGMQLKIRLLATIITSVASLIFTWLLCPTFGIAISFITSIISTTVVYVSISSAKRFN
jgi:O-antigen/teichoic acid export membrane protein